MQYIKGVKMIFRNEFSNANPKINHIKDFSFMAKIISKQFPFSKVMVFFYSKDYFLYGKDLIDELKGCALKPIVIIIKDHLVFSSWQKIQEYCVFEDVRAVIFTDKKLLPIALNMDKKVKTFLLINKVDMFGAFVTNFYIKEKEKFVNNVFLSDIEYFFHKNLVIEKDFSLTTYKQVSVYIIMLMDYLFCKCLMDTTLDSKLYYSIKKILVNFVVENDNKNKEMVVNNLLALQKLLFLNQNLYYSSPAISSYIINKNFFDLDNCYNSAIEICNIYSCMFKDRKVENTQINHSLKALAFMTGLDFNYLISSFIQNQSSVFPCLLEGVKDEIFNLITLFKHCNKRIQKQKEYAIKQRIVPLKQQVLLSGLTPISINGISALYF